MYIENITYMLYYTETNRGITGRNVGFLAGLHQQGLSQKVLYGTCFLSILR